MKRIHVAALVAVMTVGGTRLGAQQPAPPVKQGAAQHDSLKTVKKSIKADKAARKAAKAKGDTATAKKLKKQLKAEKKTKAALKAENPKPRPKQP